MPNPISPKVTTAGLAAALTTLAVWVSSLLGLEVPTTAAGALTTVLVFVFAYIVPDPLRTSWQQLEATQEIQVQDVDPEVYE